MKSKILIPMMAFVFAIGMSFTTEKPTATVWADIGGLAVEIEDPGCGTPIRDCFGAFEDGGAEYPLYHDQGLMNAIQGAGDVVRIKEVP